jgi:hypothetical protein
MGDECAVRCSLGRAGALANIFADPPPLPSRCRTPHSAPGGALRSSRLSARLPSRQPPRRSASELEGCNADAPTTSDVQHRNPQVSR